MARKRIPRPKGDRKRLVLHRLHGQAVDVTVGGEKVTVTILVQAGWMGERKEAVQLRLVIDAGPAVKILRAEVPDRDAVPGEGAT